MIGFVCCMVNYWVLYSSPEEDSWQFTNTILCLTLTSLYLIFPIYSVVFLYKNWMQLAKNKGIK